jgi:hypothetical protein
MALDQSGVFIDARCSKCSFAGQLGILNQQVRDDEFLGRLVWVYKVETANDDNDMMTTILIWRGTYTTLGSNC